MTENKRKKLKLNDHEEYFNSCVFNFSCSDSILRYADQDKPDTYVLNNPNFLCNNEESVSAEENSETQTPTCTSTNSNYLTNNGVSFNIGGSDNCVLSNPHYIDSNTLLDDVDEKPNYCNLNDPKYLDSNSFAKAFLDIEYKQSEELLKLDYGHKVQLIYNPLQYAREIHEDFVIKFCRGPKKVLLLGMNPGPWGMGQTGVPFGHAGYAREWLRVKGKVTKPTKEHPKRIVLGLDCTRNEVSGDRMWSLLKELSVEPDRLFTHVFLHNYCPVIFMQDTAKNITPPEIKGKERAGLEAVCDAALVQAVKLLGVEYLVGVGNYATDHARLALKRAGLENIKISTLMHPSPINPHANKGWRDIAIRQLTESGVIHYFRGDPHY